MSSRLMQLCPRCGHTNAATDTRYAECGTRLRAPEAEAGNNDSALPTSGNNRVSSSRRQPGWMGWVYGLVALGFFLAVAQGAKLDCQRERAGAPVNCTKDTLFLGVIPAGREYIEDVRLAQVEESSDEDGTSYRVTVTGSRGPVPLTNAFTPAYSRKYDVAKAVNEFIRSPERRAFTVNEPGMFTPETFGCLAIWIIGSVVWNLIKRFFRT